MSVVRVTNVTQKKPAVLGHVLAQALLNRLSSELVVRLECILMAPDMTLAMDTNVAAKCVVIASARLKTSGL